MLAASNKIKTTKAGPPAEDKADRFRDSVKRAQEALKGLDPKSKEAKELKKTLDKLGEEDKGNIKVSFGDLGQDKNGNPIVGHTKGSSVTIDYGNVDKVQSMYKLNASEADALDAGVTDHEGAHAVGPGLFGVMQWHREHGALYVESATYQGLRNTDKVSGLWNESWLTVDKDKLSIEQHRQNAIQNEIDRPKPQKSPK